MPTNYTECRILFSYWNDNNKKFVTIKKCFSREIPIRSKDQGQTHFGGSSCSDLNTWSGRGTPLHYMGYVQPHRVAFLRRFGLKTGIPFAYVDLACVAGAKGEGEGEGEKHKFYQNIPSLPYPPSFFPFLPIPYPFRRLLRRLMLIWNRVWFSRELRKCINVFIMFMVSIPNE